MIRHLQQKAMADFLFVILKTTNSCPSCVSDGKFVSNNQNYYPDLCSNFITSSVRALFIHDFDCKNSHLLSLFCGFFFQ